MQATIRLDGGQGRDRGVIVVREAPVVSGPLFFTLQRFPDGKYLSADSLWRSARDAFRSDDYRQKGGTLSIPIGPDILYELDSDTSYRMSINDGHELADEIERDFAANTEIVMLVHIDPIAVDDPIVDRYREMTLGVVRAIDPEFNIHDFRVVNGAARVNLIFDVAIPFGGKLTEAEVETRIKDAFAAIDPKLNPMPTVERQLN